MNPKLNRRSFLFSVSKASVGVLIGNQLLQSCSKESYVAFNASDPAFKLPSSKNLESILWVLPLGQLKTNSKSVRVERIIKIFSQTSAPGKKTLKGGITIALFSRDSKTYQVATYKNPVTLSIQDQASSPLQIRPVIITNEDYEEIISQKTSS